VPNVSARVAVPIAIAFICASKFKKVPSGWSYPRGWAAYLRI